MFHLVSGESEREVSGKKKWEREHWQQRRAERQQPWAFRQTSRPESVSPPPPLSLSKTASDQELFQLGYTRVT